MVSTSSSSACPRDWHIAAAFWPRPVVVRMSDFKSNEYASLLGGSDFEPTENNPMIGFRGASRYAHPLRRRFRLECQAMLRSETRWASRTWSS